MNNKPANCTCDYPTVIMRNGSGHSDICSVHQKYLEKIKAKANKSLEAPTVKALTVERFAADLSNMLMEQSRNARKSSELAHANHNDALSLRYSDIAQIKRDIAAAIRLAADVE